MPFLKTKTQSHSIVTGTRTEPGFPVCHPSLPGDTHSHIQTPSKCQQSFLCNVMCMAPASKAVVMVCLKKKKKTQPCTSTVYFLSNLIFTSIKAGCQHSPRISQWQRRLRAMWYPWWHKANLLGKHQLFTISHPKIQDMIQIKWKKKKETITILCFLVCMKTC